MPLKIVISVFTAMLMALAPASADRLDHLAGLQGDYINLDSKTLQRSFHIYVRLPLDYDETKTDYPVVYLLDGDIAFPMIGAYHYLLQVDEPDIPEAIIVGISYGSFDPANGNFRAIDYSTPPLEDGDPFGGAFAYQQFLKTELIPYVEKNYRANPNRRIIMGQSRGGHFALYSAYTNPDLFWGRIISNPALYPNKDLFFAGETRPDPSNARIYFSSGGNDLPHLRKDALRWFAQWSDDPAPWDLKTETIENGTHAARYVDVYRNGMKWLFADDR